MNVYHLPLLPPDASPLQGGEPDDDGESFAVVYHGEVIRASTEALLLEELREHMRLAA